MPSIELMPFTQNQNVRIYWDEQGSGDPLLLIMGLGYPSVMWYRTRPEFAKEFRTIALDNRGVGHSDIPAGPYPIPLLASDAKAVLDAAGVERAHVYGVSMGGMIAQEFALQYPDRVRSLILGCTAPGGPNAVRAEPEVIEFLTKRQPSQDAAVEAAVPYIYDSNTSRALIDEDIAIRKDWLPKPEAYFAQLQGIMMWEAYSRLDQIKVPTMVIHGESDRLVPSGNARLIADRIQGATFKLLPNASHIYATDQTDATVNLVLQFLRTH